MYGKVEVVEYLVQSAAKTISINALIVSTLKSRVHIFDTSISLLLNATGTV